MSHEHEHEQASEEFTCNATNGVLVAPLQHGASYHVVLLATNGAGLSTRTVSRSFVVDLFSNIEVRRCGSLPLYWHSSRKVASQTAAHLDV